MKKTINVLLSTYNGEKYIQEQIRSVLSQKNCNVEFLIRDDGSTDNTMNIIQSLKLSNAKLILGENIGLVKSFLFLISDSTAKRVLDPPQNSKSLI